MLINFNENYIACSLRIFLTLQCFSHWSFKYYLQINWKKYVTETSCFSKIDLRSPSSGSSGSRDYQTPESCDTQFHPTKLVANKTYSQDLNPRWTTRSGARYKNRYARPKSLSRTSTWYHLALWMNGIGWISTSLKNFYSASAKLATQSAVLAIVNTSVRPCVCPSVRHTLVSCRLSTSKAEFKLGLGVNIQ